MRTTVLIRINATQTLLLAHAKHLWTLKYMLQSCSHHASKGGHAFGTECPRDC